MPVPVTKPNNQRTNLLSRWSAPGSGSHVDYVDSGLPETGPEQEWSNGTEFSGYSDFPEYWVSSKGSPKFSDILFGTFPVPLDF